MKKTKILVLSLFFGNDYFETNEEFREVFSSLGDDVEFIYAHDGNADRVGDVSAYVLKVEREGVNWITIDPEVREKLPEAEVLLVSNSCVTAEMMDLAPNLKFIGSMRSGVENVDVQAAEARGIQVRCIPGRLADAVADMTLAMIVCETRGVIRGNLTSSHGEWNKRDIYDDTTNRPIAFLKIGIIGFGFIGQCLAKRLRACGATLLAYDPYQKEEVFAACEVRKTGLEELLQTCDVVCMMAKLTPDTKNLMGREQFALMKPTAVFVNTARAGLVDEAALIEALETKKIRGAALDVYSQEPLPKDHPLLKMNNVTLMPHRAGVTSGNHQNSMRLMFRILRRYLDGEPV